MQKSSYSNTTAPYLPAEWAPQEAILLTWPHQLSDWASNLRAVESVFVRIAAAIVRYEPLMIVCFDKTHRTHIQSQLTSVQAFYPIHYYIAPSNDSWARDHGPMTLLTHPQHRILLDFQFNGWGNQHPYALDNAITSMLYQQQAFPNMNYQTVGWVLEGGAIDTNGAGCLLTTPCVIDKKRNPRINQTDMTTLLKMHLGLTKVHWLNEGFVQGDDTGGHIDMLARFCTENTICYTHCDDPNDIHFNALNKMARELQTFTDNQNKPYHLCPLPCPPPIFNTKGQRLPASYANFLIINGAVLVPTYQCPTDEIALDSIQHCFPKRKIIGIPCSALIKQGGSLHCVTMQIPA